MRLQSFLLYIILLNFLFRLQSDNDRVFWNENKKLIWYDFQGLPDNNIHFEARSCINFESHYDIIGNYVIASFQVVFIKSKSWVKDKLNLSNNLLRHEQGHFDLCELFARKMRKESKLLKVKEKKCYEQLDKVYYKYKREYEKESFLYDKETNFSMDTINQLKWQNYVDIELAKYSDYSQPILQIPFAH